MANTSTSEERIIFHVLNGDDDVAEAVLDGMDITEIEAFQSALNRAHAITRKALAKKLDVYGTHTAPIIPPKEGSGNAV